MVVCATGFFDGVHRGHQVILKALIARAQAAGKKSAVITFWPHPRNVLQQDAYDLRLLTSLDEKKELVLSLGVDYFYVVPFSKEFSHLTTLEFIQKYLVGKYNISEMIIGYDHRLGSDGVHTQDSLINIAASCGVEAYTINEYILPHDVKVSSTKVRNALTEGLVELAATMLGYHYMMKGVVVLGNRIGRTIGFPTANMQLYEPLKLVPGNGVYFVMVEVLDKKYRGICNIGTRPTVANGNQRTIETFILDFNEDIYGLDIKLTFYKRIRSEVKFNSLDELKKQLKCDEDFAREIMI